MTRLPHVLSKEEAKQLLAAANINCPTGLRNRAMLEAMYRAGLRVKEVRGLHPSDVKLKEQRLEVLGHDLKALLFNWLNEVLYVSTTSGMLFSKFRVDIDDRTMTLKATCWGEKLDQKKHDMRGEVKAVTYHRMEVRKEGEYWRAQVIFDV